MDVLLSAVVSDLFGRSASFVINRYFQRQPGIDMILQRLERVVLRIDTVVEEAEGRHITNQGMLRQLKMLRQGMYRGHYVLDALTFQAREELQRMVDTLEDTMAGMKEFLFFLQSCPPILRQPYGAYLLLDNCMFGRQSERQRVLDFLLRPSAAPDLAVLPIVGPIRVGKTTLVEHICRDESVRDRFSMILFFPEGSLKDEGVIDDLDAEDGEGGGHGAGGLPEERGGQGGDVGDATATEMGPSPRSRKKA
uniref:Disease resistance N-terminal domain-containing protein n=1 Tax=Aegilops tauschii subsp. strangulata TaxID=200361 RepID=A0A452ZNP7_AEGTS